MRIPVLTAKWLAPVVALSVLGCPKQDLAPLGPCTVSAVSERVDQSGVSDVDLLFVIDNSGSMASEQLKIAEQLPRLVQVLTSGDKFPGVPDDQLPDGVDALTRKFTAVKTMHLGVVTTNTGGLDDLQGSKQAAIGTCLDLGDDGKLQNSTEIAVNGVTADSDNEFDGYKKGDVVIPPSDACADVDTPKYQQYDMSNPQTTPQSTSDSFRCVATVGVRGCPFEQQLESMWKALAPESGLEDDSLYQFINGSKGQGERYNKGFLREEAILAVIIVSDEEDCSITDKGKSLLTNLRDPKLNLLCGQNASNTDLIQPTDRYVRGLKSLKPNNPDRIIYAAIVGVPEDAIEKEQSIDTILKRDDMQFAEELDLMGKGTGYPTASCSVKRDGKLNKAYPPSRMLQVAKGFGDQAVIYSICAEDYTPALDKLIEKIASKLKGNCLPRQLTPGENGKVNCEVFELLPKKDEGSCPAEYGLEGTPISRVINENGKNVTRKACKMKQLAVTGANHTVADGNGWYYDNFSENLEKDCNATERQRISFRFKSGNDLPSGAGATFECFQPVARVDTDAKGFDAVNSPCIKDDEPNDGICADKSDDDYNLFCQPVARTCQIKCGANPDCPPGWVCDTGNAGADKEGQKYCQLPTCPQDNSTSN